MLKPLPPLQVHLNLSRVTTAEVWNGQALTAGPTLVWPGRWVQTISTACTALMQDREQGCMHERCRENVETIAATCRGMKAHPPRSAPVGHEWGMDLTLLRAGDADHPTLAIIDHGSRALMRLKTLTRKCAGTVLSEFCAACAKHGPPAAVRTDNEGMFTGRLWVAFFRLAGIRRQCIDSGSPWQNGRIERLFGTLKPLLRQLAIPDAAALQVRLHEFARFYNHVRVHQSPGGLTPAEVWNGQDLNAMRRWYGQGRWGQALDGLMQGYWLRL